ncbi:MAG TPA: YciI family protein [Labilithrix sp.]|jgi:hypothetical protein
MADFIYLFRGASPVRDMSADERQKNMQKWMGWMKELGAKGHFKSGEPLEDEGMVLRGKNKVVTDGPYAEAKDLVGGFLLISAKDLAEATELAKGCPIFERDGIVEVRPVAKM